MCFYGISEGMTPLGSTPSEERFVSVLSVMELLQGCLDKRELKTVKEFIKANFPAPLYPEEKIYDKAVLLLERYALSDGLRTIDALIAASALLSNAALATANYKHFKNIHSLTVIKFALSGA